MYSFNLIIFIFLFTFYNNLVIASIDKQSKVAPTKPDLVLVQKCCPEVQIMIDTGCRAINETTVKLQNSVFENNRFNIVIGRPRCGSTQHWTILHYPKSLDRLELLDNGFLRHTVIQEDFTQEDKKKEVLFLDMKESDIKEHEDITPVKIKMNYDYSPGKYCLDQMIHDHNKIEGQFAIVCVPESISDATSTHFLLTLIVNPILHGIAIILYLLVAVIYFVVPQLRDLVGNITTTIMICLIVSQAASLVRIFTQLSNHVSFMIADVIMYVSLSGAFFWLNSMGYYIWRLFRSRNVFLRVTDGRKYCYYSTYAWGLTICMAVLALFAHFMLDTTVLLQQKQKSYTDQETIGWLGIALFFTPIAFTILVDIFFYLSTTQVINRMSTYGRIHHKMKFSFEMFVKLLSIMSISWLFLMLSWLKFTGLVYTHILVNALQAILIAWICVFGQRRVTFLVRKACCFGVCGSGDRNDPPEAHEWGEEMLTINTANL